MKKNYLLMAGLASMMAFSACSNDEDLAIPAGPNFEEDGSVFEIAISNTGEGTSTKATRPMGSAAAANNVNKICLYVYSRETSADDWSAVTLYKAPTMDDDNDAVDFEKPVPNGQLALIQVGGDNYGGTPIDIKDENSNFGVLNFTDNVITSDQDDPTAEHISRRAQVKVMGLEDGKQYRLVAVGYNSNETDANNLPAFAAKGTDGFFTVTEDYATVSKTAYDIEEVFAAYENCEAKTITKWNDANHNNVQDAGETEEQTVFTLTPSLTLTRQVAGILAYLENVPTTLLSKNTGASVVVSKVAIVADQTAANTFTIPNTMLVTESGNADFNGGAIETADKEEQLIVFDMENCATNYVEDVEDVEDAIYTFAQQPAYADQATTPSKPYAEDYEAPNGLVIKKGTIFGARYLIPYDKNYDGQTLSLVFYDNNDKEITRRAIISNLSSDPNSYDIRCNNFYSIGLKYANNNTDEDKPLDLMSDEMNVQVNSAWAVLHDMDIQ